MEGLLSLFLKDGERRSAYLDKIFLAGRFLFELRLIFGCGAPPFLIILGLSILLYQRELPSEPEPEGHSEPKSREEADLLPRSTRRDTHQNANPFIILATAAAPRRPTSPFRFAATSNPNFLASE